MSEIKLNLIDSQHILSGTIHASVGDRLVAALSAEPETIGELVVALERYERRPHRLFDTFVTRLFAYSAIDYCPYDAGILIIDLTARVVACESLYSLPGAQGEVSYHSEHATNVWIPYLLRADWVFTTSIDEYRASCEERRRLRLAQKPFDVRPILYGRPLSEFLSLGVRDGLSSCRLATRNSSVGTLIGSDKVEADTRPEGDPELEIVSQVHAKWLLSSRADLAGKSPREVMLEHLAFIDSDLESRAFQWSQRLEGPPCLSPHSFAYRFAAFGSHEWITYYYLVRYLIKTALDVFLNDVQITSVGPSETSDVSVDVVANWLEQVKTDWLTVPNPELDNRVPQLIIDNERRRLPEAMSGRSMVIDEDCPICKMMGDECEAGLEVCFWHLDACNMEDDFPFSIFATREEWEADQLEIRARHEEFDRRWSERAQRIERGEILEPDPFFDPPDFTDAFPDALISEPEPPEA